MSHRRLPAIEDLYDMRVTDRTQCPKTAFKQWIQVRMGRIQRIDHFQRNLPSHCLVGRPVHHSASTGSDKLKRDIGTNPCPSSKPGLFGISDQLTVEEAASLAGGGMEGRALLSAAIQFSLSLSNVLFSVSQLPF